MIGNLLEVCLVDEFDVMFKVVLWIMFIMKCDYFLKFN